MGTAGRLVQRASGLPAPPGRPPLAPAGAGTGAGLAPGRAGPPLPDHQVGPRGNIGTRSAVSVIGRPAAATRSTLRGCGLSRPKPSESGAALVVDAMVIPAGQGERPAESEHDHGEHRAGPDSGIAPVKASAIGDAPAGGRDCRGVVCAGVAWRPGRRAHRPVAAAGAHFRARSGGTGTGEDHGQAVGRGPGGAVPGGVPAARADLRAWACACGATRLVRLLSGSRRRDAHDWGAFVREHRGEGGRDGGGRGQQPAGEHGQDRGEPPQPRARPVALRPGRPRRPAVIALATPGNQAAAPLAVGRPPECGSGPDPVALGPHRQHCGVIPTIPQPPCWGPSKT